MILFFEKFVADPSLMPPDYELIHYPFLLAGYLSLIFTALNLLPVGQLDGGHILYGLLGYERFNRVAPVVFVLFITYAGLGIITPETDWREYSSFSLLYIFYLPLVFQKVVPRFSGLFYRGSWAYTTRLVRMKRRFPKAGRSWAG